MGETSIIMVVDHDASRAFDDGRISLDGPRKIHDALGPRLFLGVLNRNGTIASYVLEDGADAWVPSTPCYCPWPEMDREVERRAGITIAPCHVTAGGSVERSFGPVPMSRI